jgi:HNH endonuclease
MARRRISETLKRKLLLEAGYRCANPTCRNMVILDTHHLDRISKGGGDSEANLIALCPMCHALHHRSQIPEDHVRTWKTMLVQLNEARLAHAIDRILFLSSDANETMFVTGDGVLICSDLIVAGLVEAPLISSTEGGGQAPHRAYRLQLTARGHQFADAWKAGRLVDLQKVLASRK